METRRLGRTGPELSVLGLGCNMFGWTLDEDTSRQIVHAALDLGVTHFDTAEMYGDGVSEEFLGRSLGSRRDDVVIATKFSPRPERAPFTAGDQAKRIREACELSLQRLGTDRIDLYYMHVPDEEAPVEETMSTLKELLDAGKILHTAASNVTAELLDSVTKVAESLGMPTFAGIQNRWNLLMRDIEQDVVPAAGRNGMGIVPYFPLASGMLTGKYKRGEAFPPDSRFAKLEWFAQFATDENFDRVERLQAFAGERGRSLIELAIAWLKSRDEVASVISGATSAEQVRSNHEAGQWELSPDDLAALESID
jgi:aryl-alcohol dehydrogenase-like predicted oxidoreductase